MIILSHFTKLNFTHLSIVCERGHLVLFPVSIVRVQSGLYKLLGLSKGGTSFAHCLLLVWCTVQSVSPDVIKIFTWREPKWPRRIFNVEAATADAADNTTTKLIWNNRLFWQCLWWFVIIKLLLECPERNGFWRSHVRTQVISSSERHDLFRDWFWLSVQEREVVRCFGSKWCSEKFGNVDWIGQFGGELTPLGALRGVVGDCNDLVGDGLWLLESEDFTVLLISVINFSSSF